MELSMKNIIYIIAAIGAIVLFAMGKEIGMVSTAIFFVLALWEKYSLTREKKTTVKQDFKSAPDKSVEQFRAEK